MNIFKSMELMEKYAECPNCGSDLIGNRQGGLILEEDTFRRFCKCGFDITVDENGNKVELVTCESCKYFLYAEDNHEEYYCNYIDDNILDLKTCKCFSK